MTAPTILALTAFILTICQATAQDCDSVLKVATVNFFKVRTEEELVQKIKEIYNSSRTEAKDRKIGTGGEATLPIEGLPFQGKGHFNADAFKAVCENLGASKDSHLSISACRQLLAAVVDSKVAQDVLEAWKDCNHATGLHIQAKKINDEYVRVTLRFFPQGGPTQTIESAAYGGAEPVGSFIFAQGHVLKTGVYDALFKISAGSSNFVFLLRTQDHCTSAEISLKDDVRQEGASDRALRIINDTVTQVTRWLRRGPNDFNWHADELLVWTIQLRKDLEEFRNVGPRSLFNELTHLETDLNRMLKEGGDRRYIDVLKLREALIDASKDVGLSTVK